MTEFEQMFIDTTNFLEENKIPYFLHGSTLLNIIRSNTVEPRENYLFDKELNFGVLAEDFTEDMYRKMADKFAYFNPQNDKFPNFLIFFGPVGKPPQDSDHWRITPGFSLLARFWDIGKYRVEYMGENHCLVFPKEFFEKKNWGKVEFMGKTFNTPKGPADYFDYYFGIWKTEDKNWHWTKSTCERNYANVKDRLEGGELVI